MTSIATMLLALAMLPALAAAEGLGFVPEPWITVDASGVAATVTPSVTTIQGSTTILSPPPSSLTQTSVYTLMVSGKPSTTTGLTPAPTAAGPGIAGAVFACLDYQGLDSPFCVPRRGSQLTPGKTYYVTWYTDYFASPNQTVQVQGQFLGGVDGWTSPMIPASQGYYAWTVDATILTAHKTSALNVSLFLETVHVNGSSIVESPLAGPVVLVTSAAASVGTGPSVSPLAVALPVVVGVAALGLLGFCIWSRRRHGRLPLVGSLMGSKRRSAQGYGVRQSRSQRVATGAASTKAPGAGIQLTPSDSWSPTQGRNVFREEIARQDRDHP